MMFVDLLHTWIASERGGTEQTRKLPRNRGVGQAGRRYIFVQMRILPQRLASLVGEELSAWYSSGAPGPE